MHTKRLPCRTFFYQNEIIAGDQKLVKKSLKIDNIILKFTKNQLEKFGAVKDCVMD